MNWLCWILGELLQWEAITALATLGGVIAVVLQLYWLRRQIDLQNYADYTKRYQEIILHFPEDVNDLNFKLNKRRQDYTETMRYMRAYADLCFEEWDLNRRRLIDEETWTGWKGGMQTAFRKPAFQQAWKVIKESNTEYARDFEEFIEGVFTTAPEVHSNRP